MLKLSSGNIYYSAEEYKELQSQLESSRITASALRNDFEIVSECLLNEAADRDWCSEYNDWVDEVNLRLNRSTLRKLEREYSVKVELTETRTVSTYVTVTAASSDEAQEKVESWDWYDVLDYANENDWESEETDFTVGHVKEA